jgi:ABC-type Fe3+/spermidine/putrescine transport system ATPase subunit
MLQVKNITFSYQKQVTIEAIDFRINKGNFLAIIGESGCGKSTLLKLIYGLYDLDKGEILWNKTPILGPKFNLIPGMDFTKYLAQDFDLMPYITVAENVGAFLSNINLENKRLRIDELLEVVEMTEFAQTKVKLLSGGQMQRVAIARVLALEPEVLLLDEPFSHIDNFRKNSLRRHLFSYLKSKNITTIIASHDTTDILSFADEIIVLQNGKLIEKATPKSIFSNPKNHYIASLFDDVNQISSHFFIEKEDKILLIYPNQLQIVENSKLEVIVKQCYFKGNFYLIEAVIEKQKIFFENKFDLEIGKTVFLDLKSDYFNQK